MQSHLPAGRSRKSLHRFSGAGRIILAQLTGLGEAEGRVCRGKQRGLGRVTAPCLVLSELPGASARALSPGRVTRLPPAPCCHVVVPGCSSPAPFPSHVTQTCPANTNSKARPCPTLGLSCSGKCEVLWGSAAPRALLCLSLSVEGPVWKAIRPGRPNEPSLTRLRSGVGRGTHTSLGAVPSAAHVEGGGVEAEGSRDPLNVPKKGCFQCKWPCLQGVGSSDRGLHRTPWGCLGCPGDFTGVPALL